VPLGLPERGVSTFLGFADVVEMLYAAQTPALVGYFKRNEMMLDEADALVAVHQIAPRGLAASAVR